MTYLTKRDASPCIGLLNGDGESLLRNLLAPYELCIAHTVYQLCSQSKPQISNNKYFSTTQAFHSQKASTNISFKLEVGLI